MTLEGENARHEIDQPEMMTVSNEAYQTRSNQEKLNDSTMPSAVDMEQLRRRWWRFDHASCFGSVTYVLRTSSWAFAAFAQAHRMFHRHRDLHRHLCRRLEREIMRKNNVNTWSSIHIEMIVFVDSIVACSCLWYLEWDRVSSVLNTPHKCGELGGMSPDPIDFALRLSFSTMVPSLLCCLILELATMTMVSVSSYLIRWYRAVVHGFEGEYCVFCLIDRRWVNCVRALAIGVRKEDWSIIWNIKTRVFT